MFSIFCDFFKFQILITVNAFSLWARLTKICLRLLVPELHSFLVALSHYKKKQNKAYIFL